jgi:hypothetical protein
VRRRPGDNRQSTLRSAFDSLDRYCEIAQVPEPKVTTSSAVIPMARAANAWLELASSCMARAQRSITTSRYSAGMATAFDFEPWLKRATKSQMSSASAACRSLSNTEKAFSTGP